MLIFWQQRLVLLATPKTGSTALSVALEPLAAIAVQRPPALKHTTAQRFRRFLAPYLETASGERFDVVALMREPLDWLGSWYRFRQRDDIAGSANSTEGLSFDAFAGAYMSRPQPAYAQLGAQARFLSLADGSLGVDKLFCYEDIGRFVSFLEERLDFEIVLPRVNVSPKGVTTLSAPLRTRLQMHLAEDLALYQRVKAGETA
ncbi:MAG: hypothetical protein Q8Q63_08470 [Phaeovulum sp.]|uniref:hypothetical protein n=1 Tax=Phaeovulum sp. TaxID=2934796 RepID=UPI002731EFEE|nr:hypothetical protein [Phaeovulum sp.]MDP2063182.1 hypothetical protein [Phaeovulum sp.]MDP3861603.1 hypothetical protein [Phaeovulum sp.]